MSRFFSEKYDTLCPYTPGEQPKERQYVKLNTNESPFPPSKRAIELAAKEAEKLMLYSDPEAKDLREVMAEKFGVDRDEVIMTNGSDEVLNFAFMAYCTESCPALFADITYGFYKVFAQINALPYKTIPLREDFTISVDDYIKENGTVFIANPNAPTGIALPLSEIERLLVAKKNNIVVIDEAYVDFGGESAVALTKKYPNLLVVGTFSKSRSMAGARLGFAIGNKELISDLTAIRYSTNPYNVNRMSMAAGIGALVDEEYFKENVRKIIENRKWTEQKLKAFNFTMTDSKANFIFARHASLSGEYLYKTLKEMGVLVRHFNAPRISDYLRITIGDKEQMQILVDKIEEILEKNI